MGWSMLSEEQEAQSFSRVFVGTLVAKTRHEFELAYAKEDDFIIGSRSN